DPSERAVLVAPRDDALRQRGTDTRQTCDLAHVCIIQVYPLSGQQWSRKLRRAAGCFAKGVRARRGGRPQLDVAGRSSGRWSEEEANTGACQRQAREDQGGAFIVHYRAWCVVRGAWGCAAGFGSVPEVFANSARVASVARPRSSRRDTPNPRCLAQGIRLPRRNRTLSTDA